MTVIRCCIICGFYKFIMRVIIFFTVKVITYVYASDIYGSPFFLVQPDLNIGIDKAIRILPYCFARPKKTGIEGE